MYLHRVCLRLYLNPLIVCITLGFTLSVSIITHEAVCYFWLECIPQQTNVCSDIKTFHSELNMNQRLFDSSCLAMHTIIFSFFCFILRIYWIRNMNNKCPPCVKGVNSCCSRVIYFEFCPAKYIWYYPYEMSLAFVTLHNMALKRVHCKRMGPL